MTVKTARGLEVERAENGRRISKGIAVLQIKRKSNFRTDPYWIDLVVDGWFVASIWSRDVVLRHYAENTEGARWLLKGGDSDLFIHADAIEFK